MSIKSKSGPGSLLALLLCLTHSLPAQVPPPNGPGSALSFNGVNDHLTASPAALPTGNAAYTIEAWMRPNTMHVGALAAWGTYGNNNQVNAFVLDVDGLVNYWWGNDLKLLTTSLAGAWHHVAATFDGTTRRIILDGVALTNDTPVGHAATAANFRIGLANAGQYFNGQMDEVRIWNVARTTNQIREAMRRQLWGNEPGLVAYWRFDEGVGLSAFDATGNATNTATLVNGPLWVASSLAPFAATVATHPASPVAVSNATLNGWVDARASWTAAQCYFEWGAEPAMTNTTLPFIAVAGGLPTYWKTPVSGLTPGRTYYFRAVAVNDLGPSYGATLTFTPDLVSTFAVFTTNGNGPGSLRQAVLDANASPGRDIITFDVTGTIALSSGGLPTGSLEVTDDLTILGPGASLLAVEGGYDQVFFRIFNITNASVTIAGLTLARGVSFGPPFVQPGCGGAILNYGTLLLSNCVLRSNAARGAIESGQPAYGGAVYNAGSLTVVNCAFLDNAARGGEGVPGEAPDYIPGQGGLALGGAIFNFGTLLTLNATFAGNLAEGGLGGTDVTFYDVGGDGGNAFGGGILSAGPATLVNCTLATDSVRGGAGGSGGINGASGVGNAGGLLVTGAVCQVLNTLIALNNANTASNVAGPVTSLGHNLIGVTNGSTGWLASDLKGSAAAPLHPMLGALALHGGGVETWFLLDGSPALDAGDDNVTNAPHSLATDARGRPRFQRAAVDIGAFERDPGNLLLVTNALLANVAGSFFRAIVLANTNPGTDTILFNIPGAGVKTLATNLPYPTIISPVIIDGYSQPGSRPNTRTHGNDAVLRIHLTGTNAGANADGLVLATSNCVVRGLVFSGYASHGLVMAGHGGHVVSGNFIGTDTTGLTAAPNKGGVLISNSANNLVGGASPSARNLISGHTLGGAYGIRLLGPGATNNVIAGNFLGTDATGTNALRNTWGILAEGAGNNIIGGVTLAARNVIGSEEAGVFLTAGANSNVLQGNYIGLDASGQRALNPTNLLTRGVYVDNSSGTLIGGTTPGASNVIAGNIGQEVLIAGPAATGNRVQGNLIGTDASGAVALVAPGGGSGYGVALSGGASGNVIGGGATGAGNVISGHNYPVSTFGGAKSNYVQGNLIGLNASGNDALPNGIPVFLQSGSGFNVIGNDSDGLNDSNEGNVIAGRNSSDLVFFFESTNNRFAGNLVGTDRSGLIALGNGSGVTLFDSSSNVIGGATAAARNVIAGRAGSGVTIRRTNSVGNLVLGNFIGADLTGAHALPNGLQGVDVQEGAWGNRVGGTAPGEGNLIAFNGGAGVMVDAAVSNAILGNAIFANGALGIDLSPVGSTVNDPGDADTGANNLQNFPAITNVGASVQGALNSRPNTAYRLEFFSNTAVDSSGYGEGETFLGATNVTTDGNGYAGFNFVPASLPPAGRFLTATATDPGGNTSEFSAAAPSANRPVIHAISSFAAPVGELLAITGANFGPAPSDNWVWFGAVRAQVLSATSTQLVVSVPPGVGYTPICITVDGLTGCSAASFAPTFTSSGGSETMSFAPNADIAFGASLGAVALADVDNDGRLDLVVANQGSGNVRIFRSLGLSGVLTSNSFAAPVTYAVGGAPNSVVVADLDGDGRLDVVTATSSAATVSVLRNLSSAGVVAFAPAVVVPIVAGTHAGLAVADLDGDGRPEVVTANYSTNTVSVLYNLSAPGTVALAAPVELTIGAAPYRVAAGDVDGDGRPDIVTANPAAARLSVLRNISAPGSLDTNSFAPKFDLPSGNSPYDVVIGDLDGDGRLDLAAAINANVVSAWRNVSTPGSLATNSFAARVDYPVAASTVAPAWPWTVGLADLNGDGRPDLFTANWKTNFVSVLRNTAAPGSLATNSFAPWVAFTTAFGPFHVVAGDLDGDGRPDLVTANTPGNSVSLLRNTLPPACVTPPSGLAAWWPGEYNALDAVGPNHGLLSNGVTFATGKVGAAFRFDGADDYVYWPAQPALDLPGSSSVSLWVNASPPAGTNALRYLFADFGNGGAASQGSLALAGNRFYWLQTTTDVAAQDLTGRTLVQTGAWYHVAVVRDDTAKVVRLYVNGVEEAQTNYAGRAVVALQGRRILGAAGPEFSNHFAGLLDEAAVFGRALNPAEVFAVFAAGQAGMCSPAPLLVGVRGGGGVARSPDKPLYAYGESVTLTATNARYFQFAGWSDGNTDPVRLVAAGVTPALVAVFTNVIALETLPLKVWEVSFGGDEFDELKSLLRTSDGGYLLAGHSDTYPNGSGNRTSPSCGGLDFWVVKLDGAGREQWQRSLGAGSTDLGAAWQTADGGYLLAGSSSSGTTPISGDCGQTATHTGYSDFWIVRLDTNGHRLWDQSFGGSGSDTLTSLAPLADGGFLLGGYSDSPPSGSKTAAAFGNFDFWVVRVDANGNKLWDRAFGSPGNDRLQALAATADGGCVLAGSSESIAGGNKTSPAYGDLDFWVLRLDAAGNKLWEHTFGTTQRDDAWAVVATAEGGFAVAGDSVNVQTERDYWVVRLDSAGNVAWSTFLGEVGDDGYGEAAYALAATPDGGFLVTGESNTQPGGNKTSPQFGGGDFWTVRLDAAGNKIWERADGGTVHDVASSVALSWDGGYVLGGTSMSGTDGNKTTTSGLGNIEDYWAINVHERTAPVGMPVILVNGLYAATGSLTSTGSTLVEITSTFTNGSIFFTLDGTDPNGGYLYTGPFLLGADATLRAVAYSQDFTRSWQADPVGVTVLTPPVLLTQPQGQVAALGATVALAVGVSGSAPLAYQWFFGGAPVADGTNAHLVFTAMANSGGNYFVTVQNSQGAVTSAVATLAVLLPPGFISQPIGTNVSPGATVTFSVTVSGTGPFTFQWRKNGLNIPGATNDTLTLANVTVADGGSYTVVVANQAGAVSSAPAVLAVGPAPTGVSNSFAGRIGLPSTASGSVAGTNTTATKEAGEPNHAGKVGGKSVWYSWTAPASGIATFSTVGSAFDTLLAVYTGTNVSNLAVEASDEDNGGALTSQLQFNALAGVTYAIAVDSFGAPAGYFVLAWMLTPSPTPLPVIKSPPASRTVTNGAEVTFTVVAEGSGLSHQWVFNGNIIPGATSSNYFIASVQPTNLGAYTVRISNSAGTVESVAAVLEIGPFAELRSVDKLRDLLLPDGGARRPARTSVAGLPTISAGTIFSQVLNTTNSGSSEGEVNPCGTIGGASRWITLVPSATATLAIDTLGSTFDTLLAVFEATVPGDLTTIQLVACDDNGAGDGARSRVVFPATGGTSYYVRVDGKSGISGLVQLNWALGSAPSLPPPPASTAPSLVRLGDSFTLSITTNGVPAPGVQWLRNDAVILQATNASLVIRSALDMDAGNYSVVFSNFIGTVTGWVAAIVVETNFITLVRNTFNAGAEDWSAVGDVGALNFVSNGGNPGGHVSAADTSGGTVWFWRAPQRVLGNKSSAYGGLLTFDLKQTLEAPLSGTLDVVLNGGGVTLVFEALRSPGTNWSAYKVALAESAGWRKGSPAGPPPTRSEMLRVLASLDALLIQGKQSPEPGLGFLDNVTLVAASTNQVAWLNHRRTTDGQFVLEWPPLPAGFHLEAKEDLNATLWTPLGATTDSTTGLNVLTNTPTQPQRFFRLRKP